MDNLEAEDQLSGNEKVIAEAKRRWRQCNDYESSARNRNIDDYKFFNADTENKYQWDQTTLSGREGSNKPCLTINKTRQHCLHIINDAKQNTPSIKIVAVGDEATFESSQVFQGLIRHIEYISNAAVAYDTAGEFQVAMGIGYWRVVTDYVDGDSFDQEIFIRRIKDPLNVYLDPDIVEKDGSDARFGYIYTDLPNDEFKELYPEHQDLGHSAALDDSAIFDDEYHVRVCEYFRIVEKEDKLIAIEDQETGELVTYRLSKVPEELKDLAKSMMDSPNSKLRTVVDNVVEWYLIIGDKIADRTIWPGKYIPIVRVIGEETVIDGQMDRKGHVRALKDPQRMYNYAASAAVEVVAYQSKSPYIADVKSIEGLETYWASQNIDTHAVLPYKGTDDDGNTLEKPERQTAPLPSPAFIQLMIDSDKQMDMASGQYEATFGEKSNERSGKAIDARQRQGETATYHYIDNEAIAIRFTGKIILDLIPKVYDTKRTLRILAEDNTTSEIMIDPQAQAAYQEQMHRHTKQVQRIFNPNVGKYDVIADVAPGYATRRAESFNALGNIISSDPSALMLVGDLWVKNSDFPDADKVAERLHNMLPPQALGAGNPQMQKMQMQMEQMQNVNGKLLQQLAEDRLTIKQLSTKRDVDVYKADIDAYKANIEDFRADTERLKVDAEIIDRRVLNPKDVIALQHKLALQEHAGEIEMQKLDRQGMQLTNRQAND